MQSNTIYDDANRRIEAKSDLFALNDNLSKSESFYDGLGRTFESRKYESDGGYIKTNTEFDALSRPKRASNPYRPLKGETPVWTESFYDSIGRTIKVKTLADNAEVLTSYVGNTVTVTDQAEKKRRSVTNALGQLMRVDEPNDAGLLDVNGVPAQKTDYVYDVLNNLTTVSQGVQTRTFQYDSLSRLKSANNPESGIINYIYDNNGNLTSKTDARNVVTNYIYDNLNRVTNRNYSAPAGLPNYQTTPNVTYTYDDANVSFSKGKLTKVTTGLVANPFSETKYLAFDKLGRVTGSQQMTDGVAYNPQSYVYNLSGALIEEVYPSGRVVKNTLDIDGDLQQVQSRKSNGTFQNYANAFTYTSAGAVSSLRLGNGKFENTTFNSRLQPIQIGLGSSATSQNLLKLNFDYGGTDNNGNVKSQTITVPTVGNIAGFVATQNYTYDSLNRLKSAEETIPNQLGWKQTFTYDRYGNRNFDTTNNNTTTLPNGCPVAVCNPSINPNDNKLVGTNYDNVGNTKIDANGQTFTYDAENKQVQVNNGSGIVGQYYYDGDGKRIKKFVPSTSETTIFVYDADGKMVAEYSTVTASTTEAKISYLTNDHLGSPRITTDATGKVISRRDFMPFGEEIERTNNGIDTIRKKFATYERDGETGLDFAQARYYNKNLGRFYSVDPENADADQEVPQSWNAYSYARNNPLKYGDPSGLGVEVCSSSGERSCVYYSESQWIKFLRSNTDGAYEIRGTKIYLNGELTANITESSFLDDNQRAILDGVYEGSIRKGKIVGGLAIGAAAAGACIGIPGACPAVAAAALRVARKILPKVATKLCFVEGTMVLTDFGLKPIEEIKEGDKVLSYNEQTKQNEYKTVVQTMVREAEAGRILSLKVEGEAEALGVTGEHPFYVRIHGARSNLSSEDDGKWIEAKDLQIGNEIRKADGTWAKVESVIQKSEGAKVYNFEVADNHNYFVGTMGLLVHNTCFPDKKELAKRLNTTVDYFHDKIKPSIKQRFPKEMNKINSKNPDIGISDNGTVVLKHPTTKRTIDTGVSIDEFVQP
jgi:RHS repeat-associated protein